MKGILKLEELAMLAISMYGLYFLEADWWHYALLALAPDISMIAYAAGNKAGAFVYDLFHHKAIGVGLFMAGIMTDINGLMLAGLIIFGHSSLDRFFGYGLKYEQGFKFTHLGNIGKTK
jgi:hypothetical protein